MLYLIFRAGGERFALGATSVIEVVPLVRLRPVPHAPFGVAGVFNYRGTVIPVIDLSRLIADTPCRPLYSTRIVVVRLELEENGKNRGPEKSERRIGLITEQTTETMALEDAMFEDPGLHIEQAPYLRGMVSGRNLGSDTLDAPGAKNSKADMIQRIDATALLTPDIRHALKLAREVAREDTNARETGP